MKVKVISALVLTAVATLLAGRCTSLGRKAQFVMGGALVDVGYGLQDGLESYDFEHHHEITPEQVWEEMLQHNRLSSGMRSRFPRTPRHPLVALLVCMDARIDTNELVGDTRRYYYVIRTAGSVMSERELEMLELAVANGVKLVVLTTHSDCAAEKAAGSPELRERFPALGRAVDERERRVNEFLARPAIAAATERGELAVKRIAIETLTDQLVYRARANSPR
jgi:carbonic anhydrase